MRTASYGDDVQKSFPAKFRSLPRGLQRAREKKQKAEATMISQKNDEKLPEILKTEDEAVSVEQVAEKGGSAAIRARGQGEG